MIYCRSFMAAVLELIEQPSYIATLRCLPSLAHDSYLLAASPFTVQSIERKRMLVHACRLSHLSVCLSICRSVQMVYCGKTADWIWMLFGVVSGVGQGMVVLHGGDGDCQREGQFKFWGKCGASRCNERDFVT